MEVAAFHPLRTWHNARPGRLVSVALFLAFGDRSRDRLIAAGRYPASCSAEPGLSSPRTGFHRRAATVWLASDANGSTAQRSIFAAGLSTLRVEAPTHRFSRAQRHNGVLAERVRRWNDPRFAFERDGGAIARQAIEVRAVEARERFEPFARARSIERFRVELDGGGRGIASGAATGAFLRISLGRLGIRSDNVLRGSCRC